MSTHDHDGETAAYGECVTCCVADMDAAHADTERLVADFDGETVSADDNERPARSTGVEDNRMTDENVGVCCGKCGGPVYMETCGGNRPGGCEWVVAGECQQCGERTPHVCPDHGEQP